jgi:dienelactone hydrolase
MVEDLASGFVLHPERQSWSGLPRTYRSGAVNMVTLKTLTLILAVGMHLSPPSRAEQPQRVRLPITFSNVDYDLSTRIYRPVGTGPFPLAIINHGIPADRSKLSDVRPGFERAARWFVSRGYMVVVALRPGFGNSSGPYMEDAGHCRMQDFVAAGRKTAAIEAAIVAAASKLPGADPKKVLVIGQSAGGFGAIALASMPSPGVIGVISFSGGRGSNGREFICAGEDRLIEATRQLGAANRLPQLWFYAVNDRYFRPDLARQMMGAYAGASALPIRFIELPHSRTMATRRLRTPIRRYGRTP